MNRNLNPEEFSDEQLAAALSERRGERSAEFGRFRDAHERAGFAFDRDKMRYEYGATPDFTSWGGGPPTLEHGVEPDHVYRVEGPEGMAAFRESGQLGSTFGRDPGTDHTYTHVSRYPEGKYAGPGSRVLKIQNAPGRFRAKTTLDRAYAVAEDPIPAEDVEDLGEASEYPLVTSPHRASSPPVDVFDHFTPSSSDLEALETEDMRRRMNRSDPFADLMGRRSL